MLKLVIVDDEPLAVEILDGYLKRFAPDHTVLLFSNAHDALYYIEHHEVDVLFLDIEMPQMTGIEFLKNLTNPPLTVFTTAYRDYAFEGYELGVIDFLLKPISYNRFIHAIEKVKDFLTLKDQNSNIEDVSVDSPKESIFVKSGVQRIKLQFDDVTHIQGLKDYAIIYTNSGKILLKGSIKAMLDIFPSESFIRVHKSFIVSIAKITRTERNRIVLKDQQIPIGRNYKDNVNEIVLNRKKT